MTAVPTQIPTFIGSFRSGTTLLINLLGLHPEIAPWFETKALCEALRWLRVLNDPNRAAFESRHIIPPQPAGFSLDAVVERMRHDFRSTATRLRGESPSGKMDYERYPIGHDCALYSLADAEAALDEWHRACVLNPKTASVAAATGQLITQLGARHATLAEKPTWVNKTPGIPRFLPELRQCLGPCRMVLLIRNAHHVVRSASRLGWANAIELAEWWKVLIEETRAGARSDPTNYLEIRYEDLIHDPVGTLNSLLEFMTLKPVGAQLVADYLQRIGIDAFRPIGTPQQDFGGDYDMDAVDAIVGELMRGLGYL